MRIIFLFFFSVLLIIGCSSISTTSDYDPSADFASYNTFSIYDGTIEGSELETAPLVKKRVLEGLLLAVLIPVQINISLIFVICRDSSIISSKDIMVKE